jgi:hypothetical protein
MDERAFRYVETTIPAGIKLSEHRTGARDGRAVPVRQRVRRRLTELKRLRRV